ncbi:RDD family protein [Luteolibacter sp. SL250]|uniref:RDD family protein n=1 Tax=Luteolibacter sp. SL250 TaxID=2995170 RepID=UPI0022712DBE|nr:RDD family protein [Luteolibacter sp. SL250]WAC20826.1 RDD family protein [Luteolibacter sp. SL250]
MAAGNPYQPPASDSSLPEEIPEAQELAPLGDRFGASIVDGIIIGALPLLFGAAFAIFLEKHLPDVAGAWIRRMEESDFWSGFIDTMVSFVIFVGVQGHFLAKNGQTIGKKLLGIKIVTMEGKKPRMEALLLLRMLVPVLLATIPVAGPYIYLAGILIIFTRPRRCFHDYIAGTKVVQATVLPRGVAGAGRTARRLGKKEEMASVPGEEERTDRDC